MSRSLITLAAVTLFAVPTFAQRPAECENVAPSIGAVPAHLARVCAQPSDETIPTVDPTDTGWGTETQTSQLQTITLNAPGATSDIGGLGTFHWACDFVGNDFTELLCYADSNDFVSLSTTDASSTTLGNGAPGGAETWTGMAWDHTTGTLYAAASECNVSSSLHTVNPADGTPTSVGSITNSTCIIAIAIDTDGTLYGYDVVSNSLLSIDKGTAAGTVIGDIGFDANFGQGMDFDHADGTCYLFAFNNGTFVSELRTCDTSTGATTLVGQIGVGLLQWGAGAVETADVPVELEGFSVD